MISPVLTVNEGRECRISSYLTPRSPQNMTLLYQQASILNFFRLYPNMSTGKKEEEEASIRVFYFVPIFKVGSSDKIILILLSVHLILIKRRYLLYDLK